MDTVFWGLVVWKLRQSVKVERFFWKLKMLKIDQLCSEAKHFSQMASILRQS